MAAKNSDPYRFTKGGGLPHTFLGLVQAGATVAIKVGEICTWDETTGYFIPVNAVADHRYRLAIAKEEQKATALGEDVVARYIEFYSCHPDDMFEFILAAAAAIAVGDPYTLTASDSQKLTAGAGAFAVAIAVGQDNYPQRGTSISSKSYGLFSFNPICSYWGYRFSQLTRPGRKVISIAADGTLKESDMYNSLVLITGTTTVTLPAVKPGMDVIFINADGADENIDPNASDQIRLAGAQLTAGNKIANSTIGDCVQLVTESVDGFIAIMLTGTWTDGGA